MTNDLTVADILDSYHLSAEHKATLELACLTDDPRAVEKLEPMLTDACRALREEANAEAEFNERFHTDR